MRIKYFFLILTFYLQTTMSGPLKDILERRNVPTTSSPYLRFRRQAPPAPGAGPSTGHTVPPGMTIPPGFAMPGDDANATLQAGNTFPPGFTMNKEDLERIKPQGPTSSTSGIKYPYMPKLDVNNTEPCDIIAYYCPKSYKTGKVCGRATNFIYKTFETYCHLDYINCKEQTNVWKIGYMGECIPKPKTAVKLQPPPIYEYHDDYFLDDIFVMDETFHEDIMEKLEPIHNPIINKHNWG